MRINLSVFALLAAVVLLCLPVFGQSTRSSNSTNASTQITDSSWFLNGHVVLEDGTVPTERVDIESTCDGKRHVEAHIDKKGDFSFRLGASNNSVTQDASSTSIRSAAPSGTFNVDPTLSMSMSQNPLGDCVVRAVLVGYRSDVIVLAGHTAADNPNLGTIVLHSAGKTGSGAVTAGSLAAPKNAQKAFDKGVEAVKNKKNEEATKNFEEAVKLYPQYAEAWYELGRVQASLNQAAASRQSFDAALKADPSYTPPYMKIAQLEQQARNWTAVAEITGQLLKIAPDSDPLAYLYNSAANLNLKNVEAAEQSAREGLKHDTAHRIPKFWQILGVILANRGELAPAIEQFKNYLQFAPDGPDAASVRTQLAQCEKLAGASAPPK